VYIQRQWRHRCGTDTSDIEYWWCCSRCSVRVGLSLPRLARFATHSAPMANTSQMHSALSILSGDSFTAAVKLWAPSFSSNGMVLNSCRCIISTDVSFGGQPSRHPLVDCSYCWRYRYWHHHPSLILHHRNPGRAISPRAFRPPINPDTLKHTPPSWRRPVRASSGFEWNRIFQRHSDRVETMRRSRVAKTPDFWPQPNAGGAILAPTSEVLLVQHHY
jgi:hypothetical protein